MHYPAVCVAHGCWQVLIGTVELLPAAGAALIHSRGSHFTAVALRAHCCGSACSLLWLFMLTAVALQVDRTWAAMPTHQSPRAVTSLPPAVAALAEAVWERVAVPVSLLIALPRC